MRTAGQRQANFRRWLLAGWLSLAGGWTVTLVSGCHRQGGASSERAAVFTQAVQSLRAAASSAAQATECALTATALLSFDRVLAKATKQRLVYIADAAEGATGACDRAAQEMQRLDSQCHDHWDSNCDYLMARIAIMAETAKNRAEMGCARVNEQDPLGADAGSAGSTTR